MIARVTQFDIDTVAISRAHAIDRFARHVLPALTAQPAYRGVCVMNNEEGRGLLISYWDSEHDAEAGIQSGFYDAQVQKFLTVYRQSPSREQYEVSIFEAPANLARTAKTEIVR